MAETVNAVRNNTFKEEKNMMEMTTLLSTIAGNPEETGLIVQTVGEKSLILPTVDNPTWITLMVEETDHELRVTIGDLSDVRDLYERVLDDNIFEEEIWEFPKEIIEELSEIDPQAIFKIAAILDEFSGLNSDDFTEKVDPEVLVEKIQILSEKYALEVVFEILMNASHESMEKLLETESQDDTIRVYDKYFA